MTASFQEGRFLFFLYFSLNKQNTATTQNTQNTAKTQNTKAKTVMGKEPAGKEKENQNSAMEKGLKDNER